MKGHRSVVKRPQPAAGKVLAAVESRVRECASGLLPFEQVCFHEATLRTPSRAKAISGRRERATRPRPLNERSQPGPAGPSVGWRGPAFSHAATRQLLDCSLTLWFR